MKETTEISSLWAKFYWSDFLLETKAFMYTSVQIYTCIHIV